MQSLDELLAEINSLISEGLHQEAIEVATKSLQAYGDKAELFKVRSSAFAENGQRKEARKDADRAIALDPGNVHYVIHAALLAISSGSHHTAIGLLTPWLGNKDVAGLVERVMSDAQAEIGETRLALSYAEQALQYQPENLEFAEHVDFLKRHLARQIKISKKGWLADGSDSSGRKKASALEVQYRVIYALILREITGQYDKSKLGYLWAFIEPVAHFIILGFFFTALNHSHPPLGHNLYLFYLTGLIPYFLMVHTATKLMRALRDNQSLLLLPAVKVNDILVARGVLSFLTELAIGVIAVIGFNVIGIQAIPDDGPFTLWALAISWFFGFSLGVFLCSIYERFEAISFIWEQVTKVAYFLSGIFYVAEKIPPQTRNILVYDPILQCLELVRMGFYAGYSPPWISQIGVLMCSFSFLALGLLLFKIFGHGVEVQA